MDLDKNFKVEYDHSARFNHIIGENEAQYICLTIMKSLVKKEKKKCNQLRGKEQQEYQKKIDIGDHHSMILYYLLTNTETEAIKKNRKKYDTVNKLIIEQYLKKIYFLFDIKRGKKVKKANLLWKHIDKLLTERYSQAMNIVERSKQQNSDIEGRIAHFISILESLGYSENERKDWEMSLRENPHMIDRTTKLILDKYRN